MSIMRDYRYENIYSDLAVIKITWEDCAMRDLSIDAVFQANAVVDEYRRALSNGAYRLAVRIKLANPDLQTRFDEIDANEEDEKGEI